ncbi:hypothetical protein [Nesterenkonia ebinurensis]|uniref:hypothetical protein n=1 Tax=Nesterenkonia ebinurensis TaxID=2608252 RepID=UPI00123DDE1A|nr:hypothetical protein [Nesterenkonia ebinurensis]
MKNQQAWPWITLGILIIAAAAFGEAFGLIPTWSRWVGIGVGGGLIGLGMSIRSQRKRQA